MAFLVCAYGRYQGYSDCKINMMLEQLEQQGHDALAKMERVDW